MSQEKTSEKKTEPADDKAISLKEFLEIIHPGRIVSIKQKLESDSTYFFRWPTIKLNCPDHCVGERFFSPEDEKCNIYRTSKVEEFIRYSCKNCGKSTKLFAIFIVVKSPDTFTIVKLGEHPAFGPPVSPRVVSLVGVSKDDFFKGRRCESQGLGIGAFAYYRRIVETQKNRILDELIRACKKLNADTLIIEELANAKKETQFSKAVESMKRGLPDSLLIQGQHNPLTLLHNALSAGLHSHSDEDCLQYSQDIRVVLTDLARRVSEALQSAVELDTAVSRLLKGNSPKKRSDES